MPWFRFSGFASIACSFAAPDTFPGELRDIAPPIDLPEPAMWPYYAAGALCLLGGAMFWWLRRRRAAAVAAEAAEALIPRPAHEVALEGLTELTIDDPKVFYVALTETLRRYLAGRFGVEEVDATASELLAVLFRKAEIAEQHRRLLADLFAEADLVKFAGVVPETGAPARALAACRTFVEETAQEAVDAV